MTEEPIIGVDPAAGDDFSVVLLSGKKFERMENRIRELEEENAGLRKELEKHEVITGWKAIAKFVGHSRQAVKRWIAYHGFPPGNRPLMNAQRTWGKSGVATWLRDNPELLRERDR